MSNLLDVESAADRTESVFSALHEGHQPNKDCLVSQFMHRNHENGLTQLLPVDCRKRPLLTSFSVSRSGNT